MAEKLKIYKCEICGNIVEVLHGGAGTLVCCGEPMKVYSENSVDAALEKHVPVVEKTENGLKIKVGSVPHPMTEAHYIEWIELLADGKTCLHFLNPGDEPEVFFPVLPETYTVRAYCNLHGLWKNA